MKSVYFLSDAHLGCRSIPHDRTRERRLVHFLDGIKDKASAVYLLGDIFDFWYEYKTVVPRGYTRFLGKLSELADRGVEVHFFTGNHDIWCGDHLVKECGATLHTEPMTVEMVSASLSHISPVPSESIRFCRMPVPVLLPEMRNILLRGITGVSVFPRSLPSVSYFAFSRR